jgi:probable rRNA maturation factor
MLLISKTIHGALPSVPFLNIKKQVLADDYELSLVFIGDKKSKKLNNQYRHVDKRANVLTFLLDKNSGEIFINPHEARRNAVVFGLSYKKMLMLLFIHGMLHLKGITHGSRMERMEQKILLSL